MGEIRYRKDRKRWFVDYVAADGRRIREAIGEGDEGKRLAKKVLAQREAEAQLGIHHLPAAQTMRFGEFADDWIRRLRARGLAQKTLDTYQSFIAQHLTPAFGETRLGALTRKNIEDYLVRKIEMPRTPQKTRKKDAKQTPPPSPLAR